MSVACGNSTSGASNPANGGASSGGSSSGGASNSAAGASSLLSAIPEASYAEAFASGFCNAIGPCCTANTIAFDAASCHQNLQAALATEVAASASLHVSYNPSIAASCVTSYRLFAGLCQVSRNTQPSASCDQVFTGTLSPGAACSDDSECTGTLATCCAGVCSAAQHGQVGAACIGNCAGGNCATQVGAVVGQAPALWCFAEDQLYCSPTTHVCASLVQTGQSCEEAGCADSRQCSGDVCVNAASFCDPSTSECRLQLGDGSACTNDGECLSGSCVLNGAEGACAEVNVTLANTDTCSGLL